MNKLSDTFTVTGQLNSQRLLELAATGVKTVINNRPDGEAEDQPRSEELANAARSLGLIYLHLPMVPNERPTQATIDTLSQVLAEAPQPQVAFCRTGKRAAILWELAVANGPEKHETQNNAARTQQ